jgi:hypothetical protein
MSEATCFDSQQGQNIYLFSTASRSVLVPTQRSTQRVPAPFSGVKRKGRKADHSPPPLSRLRMSGIIYSPPIRLHVMYRYNYIQGILATGCNNIHAQFHCLMHYVFPHFMRITPMFNTSFSGVLHWLCIKTVESSPF